MSKRNASATDAEDRQDDGSDFRLVGPKRHRVALACVICRQRKIKCDGRKPCKTCIDAKRPGQCEYQSATPLRDDDYVRSLEERVRELSSKVSSSEPSRLHHLEPSFPLPVPPNFIDDNGSASIHDSTGMSASPGMVHQSYRNAPFHISGLAAEPVNPPSPPSGSASVHEEQYLTTLASPSISNRYMDSGDSSARTLLHSVEAAIQQLPHRKGLPTQPQREPSYTSTSPRPRAVHLPFVWNQSKAELYTLPQRQISDALVNVYRALNYPIFKVLHWPTFMRKYEATFTGGKQADPIWLGILNQIYAIACQIGGRDIVGDDEFEAGHKFHQRALALGYPVALCTESLQGLQFLLLMGQYLLSTSQPTLCRNVVGHAVRSAQAQGLHAHWQAARLTPVQAELQRRAWAGVIILDATASAVLGLPPLLSPEGLSHVLPSGEEDDNIVGDSTTPPAVSETSSSLFLRETTKLLAIQIQVLSTLYSSASIATSGWPDVNNILLSARALDRWQAGLPLVLETSEAGGHARAGSHELALQAHVLHARFLNLKLLIHRPMLFHVCQRASSNDLLGDAPSHLDADIARGSMAHCCSAALLLIEHVTDSWETGRRVGGAWWFHLYYFHSACLVIIAGLIIEVIASAKSISCLPDLARAIKAIKSAETYLSVKTSQNKSILPRLPSGPARSTARSCCRIIAGLTGHILAAAPHLQNSTYVPAETGGQGRHGENNNADHLNRPNSQDQQPSDMTLSDTTDLYQAFLNLFPDVPTLPNYEIPQLSLAAGSSSLVEPSLTQNTGAGIVDATYLQPEDWETSLNSTWSIGDLLRAGSAPQPMSNEAFDALYGAPSYGNTGNYTSGNSVADSQNDLGFLSRYAGT